MDHFRSWLCFFSLKKNSGLVPWTGSNPCILIPNAFHKKNVQLSLAVMSHHHSPEISKEDRTETREKGVGERWKGQSTLFSHSLYSHQPHLRHSPHGASCQRSLRGSCHCTHGRHHHQACRRGLVSACHPSVCVGDRNLSAPLHRCSWISQYTYRHTDKH